ncbi:hypothetical protein EGW08_014046 [Elysia chlorotica]|uniref:Uncharacterized protein n=1 Tax=Elysia chlorotica TaxID=188477 RepID=A0A3S0ZYC6_ELYCH|nr:hypothetical protein EGW08_014046 [Elysia chlorotica]
MAKIRLLVGSRTLPRKMKDKSDCTSYQGIYFLHLGITFKSHNYSSSGICNLKRPDTYRALGASHSPDDFLGKLSSPSTDSGASPIMPSPVSLSEGPDNEGVIAVTNIHTIPSDGMTATSFTGTSSVNFGSPTSDILEVGANSRNTAGVNSAQLPGTGTGTSVGDATASSNTGNLGGPYTDLSTTGYNTRADGSAVGGVAITQGSGLTAGSNTGSVDSSFNAGYTDNTGSLSSTSEGSLPGVSGSGSSAGTGPIAIPTNVGTPVVNPPYLPMGGAAQTGGMNNFGPGAMQYMTPGVPSQPTGNQIQPTNTWGPSSNNHGIMPQGPTGQYNQGNLYNPYMYNPYNSPWTGYGHPYNNQMYGPGGYTQNNNGWQGAPSPNPNTNTNSNPNLMANNNMNAHGGNSLAGHPGGNVGGGGYNHYNAMNAWQAAQTQSWLYPMFLFDMF